MIGTLWIVGLFAQSGSTDPIVGASGWVGAGLLGAVLSWLLFVHLPAKDKQIRELTKDCDEHKLQIIKSQEEHNRGIMSSCLTQLQQQRTDFDKVITFLATQNEKYVTVLAEALRQEFKGLREEFKALRESMIDQNGRANP